MKYLEGFILKPLHPEKIPEKRKELTAHQSELEKDIEESQKNFREKCNQLKDLEDDSRVMDKWLRRAQIKSPDRKVAMRHFYRDCINLGKDIGAVYDRIDALTEDWNLTQKRLQVLDGIALYIYRDGFYSDAEDQPILPSDIKRNAQIIWYVSLINQAPVSKFTTVLYAKILSVIEQHPYSPIQLIFYEIESTNALLVLKYGIHFVRKGYRLEIEDDEPPDEPFAGERPILAEPLADEHTSKPRGRKSRDDALPKGGRY